MSRRNRPAGKTTDCRINTSVRRIFTAEDDMGITKKLYMKMLENGGFKRDEDFPLNDPNQFQYKLNHDMGTGIFRCYIAENMFAIDIQEFCFFRDTLVRLPEPAFLSIRYYRSVSGEELHPYDQLSPNTLRAYVSGEDKIYQALFHKNIPVSSVSISIMPPFYEHYLKEKLDGNVLELSRAFRTISGGTDHPQLVLLLRQVQSYHGFGPPAKLFYEGKVLEALALILDEAVRNSRAKRSFYMSAEDEENLAAAIRYIDHHFAFGITLEQLSKIAFMGTTKLKIAFKEYTGCSVSEYLIRKRIDHAQHLLIATHLRIAEIAKAVGYERSDSFSSQFFRITGFRPSEYRNLLKEMD